MFNRYKVWVKKRYKVSYIMKYVFFYNLSKIIVLDCYLSQKIAEITVKTKVNNLKCYNLPLQKILQHIFNWILSIKNIWVQKYLIEYFQ